MKPISGYWRASRRAVMAGALLAVAGCGGSRSAEGGQAVLNIGDQSRLLQIPLELSGEGKGIEPKLRWSTFTDGPHMNAAFLANAIDIGWMGDTPALLAAAAQADVVVIAGGGLRSSNYYQIVAPPGSRIRSLADLRGKRVAFTKGTALQGYLLLALQTVGLRQTDIVPVDLPAVSLGSALKSGGADAAILVGPVLTGYLLDNPRAVQIPAPVSSYNVLLATRKALADPAKAPLIEDFVAREARAWRWVSANEEQWWDVVFRQVYHQGPAAMKLLKDRNVRLSLVGPVGDDLRAALGKQAVLLSAANVLPQAPVAERLFDPAVTQRFNAIFSRAAK